MANVIPFSVLKEFLITGKGVELGKFLPPDTDLDAVVAQLETGIEAKHISAAGLGAAAITDGSVTLAKLANMATASVYYRKTAQAGAPEVNTLATLRADMMTAGTVTATMLANSAISMKAFLGVNATGGAAPATLTGAKVGDIVIGVINLTDGAGSTVFESMITMPDQIQQASANLSAKTLFCILIPKGV